MSSRTILCLTFALSAVVFTVNELVIAEPDEMQNNGTSMISNITLPENMTKVLQLQVNFTNKEFDLDSLNKQGYVINAHIKSDNYNTRMEFPISDYLAENPILTIPIVNNGTDVDDGGDFRIDVSINQFDDRFEKVNYPILKNATFGSVNIDEMLSYVIEDEKEEGNFIEDTDDSDDDEEPRSEAEYALYKGVTK